MNLNRYSILIILSMFCLSHVGYSADSEFKVLRVIPTGQDVPAARQIVIQFNQPVVPLGRMQRSSEEIPISITPELKCDWMWLSPDSLACNLGNDSALKPATKYHMEIRPEIKTQTGEQLKIPYAHEFITERPAVSYTYFNTWQSPVMPILQVVFNLVVKKESVLNHLYFSSLSNPAKHYPITIVKEESLPNNEVQPPSETQQPDDQKRIWYISPAETLPLNTTMCLKVQPGVESTIGTEKGIEDREVVKINTFPEFTFLGVGCYSNSGKYIQTSQQIQKNELKCNPLEEIKLVFSSPVNRSEIKTNASFTPDFTKGREDDEIDRIWETTYDNSYLNMSHERKQAYWVTIPPGLKANQEYRVQIPANKLTDEFKRPLTQAVDVRFYTDHRKSNYVMMHQMAVLEKQVDSEKPVVVTNLDQVLCTYNKLTTKESKENLMHVQNIPDVKDIAFAVPLGIRDMLKQESGVVVGTLSSSPHVSKSDYERVFFAQVTPFAVNVKLGHYNTLVWVTDLQTGKPVSGATVSIYQDEIKTLTDNPVMMSESKTDTTGIAMLDGTDKLDPNLEFMRNSWEDFGNVSHLIVRVTKDNDMALLPLNWQFELDMYRMSNNTFCSDVRKQYGHIRAWGTTAQGLYRTGDTIQYKIFVRNFENRTYGIAPKKSYKLSVFDPKGKTVYEQDKIELSEFGTVDGTFQMSTTSSVGWYQFVLSADYTDITWQAMQVLVSDFTPSPFKVECDLNQAGYKPEDSVAVSTHAVFHNGGAYPTASTRISAQLKPMSFVPDNPVTADFSFSSDTSLSSVTVFQQTSSLDDKGKLETTFDLKGVDANIVYGQLMVESAVMDDRGKWIANVEQVPFLGRDRFVGLKSTKWLYNQDEASEIEYVVVNAQAKPVADVSVKTKVARLETKAARVKGAGNAYLTQYTDEWVIETENEYLSGDKPKPAQFIPKQAGFYRITAEIYDTQNRIHQSTCDLYVLGKGQVFWHEPEDYHLVIVPEKSNYRIGETVRLMIKNPFPGAMALFTIERFGVIKHWLQTLETSMPVIEIPVEQDYMPGFYVSVLVVSPRVPGALPEVGQVDLAKPSFRMGYISLPVKDSAKEIQMDVKSEQGMYKPGDTVRVSIHTRLPEGAPKEKLELGVTVLDEAVFDLLIKGRSTFDPYEGFYQFEGLDVRNFSLLTRLLGRQQFEKKGATPGGDGGPDLGMRSNFKFVSYWNSALLTDSDGNASIEFQAPDNLTGWRVLVFGVSKTDLMGLGQGTFKVSRSTEIRPVMPNQVLEGDVFSAGFRILNRMDNSRDITVHVQIKGSIDTQKTPSTFETKISLLPFKGESVFFPVQTQKNGKLIFEVQAFDTLDKDGLIHQLPVLLRQSNITAASYGTTTDSQVKETVVFPKEIDTRVGNVSVVTSPSVIGNIQGAFEYMRDYPYMCWEQKLTKGVMASHYLELKRYLPPTLMWNESGGLPEQILTESANYQAPNGGMTYYIPLDEYVSPYLSAYTALAFHWLRQAGYSIPAQVESNLHTYLLNLLRQEVFPDFYSRGMAATVRAVALAALAFDDKITVSDVNRYIPHVPYMSLFGKAHFLMALSHTKGANDKIETVLQQVLSHASQTSGKFFFNEELDDGYARILATPLRDNCAILSSLTTLDASEQFHKLIGDIPFKLVRSITQTRGNRDHFENTQENMFCMNALTDYSRMYENQTVDMNVEALVDAESIGKTSFDDVRDEAVTFSRNIQEKDPGRKSDVLIKREGQGRVYYAVRIQYSQLPAYTQPINAGIEIRKEYSVERDGKWIRLENPMEIQRGELVRVDIFLSLPTVRNFVVVDDPVPGGLEPVNRDLATTSVVDAAKGDFIAADGSFWYDFDDWHTFGLMNWSFYHKELRHDVVRFYSEYLPSGHYHLSYTAQAIACGEFLMMPVHAGEMYDADVFGKGVEAKLIIRERDHNVLK
ncbi:MAG: large extracellular alpha-helical protein [Desulfobacterales bacterium]|nr:large extracellular alpha-helical protein [Desulfobacterales bacterium]